jgi:hypothetical protein
MQNNAEIQAHHDFQKAVNQAFWRKIRQWLGRGCNDLLSYNEVFQFLQKQPQRQLGRRKVPLAQIVGSAGRYNDFDLAYRPRRESSKQRWVRVATAKYQGVKMPPVLLYQVGQAYFVEDGNHRVSVARSNGETFIEAQVIEIDASNLPADPACLRLGYKLEKS